jgi:hypothetical protein
MFFDDSAGERSSTELTQFGAETATRRIVRIQRHHKPLDGHNIRRMNPAPKSNALQTPTMLRFLMPLHNKLTAIPQYDRHSIRIRLKVGYQTRWIVRGRLHPYTFSKRMRPPRNFQEPDGTSVFLFSELKKPGYTELTCLLWVSLDPLTKDPFHF